ncbi:hypothetical protein TL16_g09653 [Triparma laevis f. inornata]|nr:hypothetical protein TL16_g09653 [Triparma laevis f. inornata]
MSQPACHAHGTPIGHIIPGSCFVFFFTLLYILDIKHELSRLKLSERTINSGDALNGRRFLLSFGILCAATCIAGSIVELIPSTKGTRPWFVSILHLGLYSSWLLVAAACFLQRGGYLGKFSVLLAMSVAAWFNAVILSGHLEQHMATAGRAMR